MPTLQHISVTLVTASGLPLIFYHSPNHPPSPTLSPSISSLTTTTTNPHFQPPAPTPPSSPSPPARPSRSNSAPRTHGKPNRATASSSLSASTAGPSGSCRCRWKRAGRRGDEDKDDGDDYDDDDGVKDLRGGATDVGTIQISARRALLRPETTYALAGVEGLRSGGEGVQRVRGGKAMSPVVKWIPFPWSWVRRRDADSVVSRFTAGEPIEWPRHSFRETRIPGEEGLLVEFIIFYLSRDVLERWGCKPIIAPEWDRKPTISEPSFDNMPHGDDSKRLVPATRDASRGLKNPFAKARTRSKEIRQLKARLALLERSPSVKRESSDLDESPRYSTVGIKSEPDDSEEERERKRMRSS
ncbi:hypothetical protein MMC34_005062 [Xylographa carneopallida]|nr:hypothetical protein [Xylographa carneopallida]